MQAKLGFGSVNLLALLAGAALGWSGAARADQVIADDLIVQGSGCIGLDCVNNENFGFNTLVLKENNLRIFFDDTSVSAGFPANKWQITVNDSASGGANFFAVDDVTGGNTLFKLNAGARANAFVLGSNSKIGLGTATPVLDLHILTGDTPAMRFEQDASGGFTAQTWDVAGNEANFFVRDLTGGSRLPFRIRPGAPTSSIDIAATGFVGMGTASPTSNLHIAGTTNPTIQLEATGTPAADWKITASGGANMLVFRDGVSGNAPFKIFNGAPTNSMMVASDGSIRFANLPNCVNGIKTNSIGTLSCIAGPTPRTNAAVSDSGSNLTLASYHSNSSFSATGQGSNSAADDPNSKSPAAGCSTGDMAGNWSMFGTNIAEAGSGSVLWCDVHLASAGTNPIKYSVTGKCRNHTPDEAVPQDYAVSGVRSITVTPACGFNGSFNIKQGSKSVTATIVEGRIEASGSSKTRAVGLSRWPHGKSFVLQTFVMQR
ncbi:MAG TPA: hypothetical protein VG986_04615 [Pseudolabrys sp.]|nr:hypothetical protein [Pseudolabrys sp.]